MGFEGYFINELEDFGLCSLVHFAAVDGTIDKGGCLSGLQCQELFRVVFDFLLGNFQDFGDNLSFVTLKNARSADVMSVTAQKACAWIDGNRMIHTDFSKFSQACLRMASYPPFFLNAREILSTEARVEDEIGNSEYLNLRIINSGGRQYQGSHCHSRKVHCR